MFRLSQETEQPNSIHDFVNSDPRFIKWTDRLKDALAQGQNLRFHPHRIRPALYRPLLFPTAAAERDNRAICLTGIASEKPFLTLFPNAVTDLHLVGPGCGTQCFPLYTYSPDGARRRDNITDWALARFREHYLDPSTTKSQIFHYVYASFADAGSRLARLHLDYEQLQPYPLEFFVNPACSLSCRVEDKMRFSKDKRSLVVNPSLTLAGIPPGVFDYRLGNRSALEWVIDQYQVTEDPRSGIRLDPNRPDDPEYIVRLLGQVIRLSLENLKTVRNLPAWH